MYIYIYIYRGKLSEERGKRSELSMNLVSRYVSTRLLLVMGNSCVTFLPSFFFFYYYFSLLFDLLRLFFLSPSFSRRDEWGEEWSGSESDTLKALEVTRGKYARALRFDFIENYQPSKNLGRSKMYIHSFKFIPVIGNGNLKNISFPLFNYISSQRFDALPIPSSSSRN